MSAYPARIVIVLGSILAIVPQVVTAQTSTPPTTPAPTSATPSAAAPSAPPGGAATLTPSELEVILAPIALYPDVLLSQVLAASTYPMDVVMASRWLATNPDISKVTAQPWDPSVLSLCHYPNIIKKMNEDLDWTNALGTAFLSQQKDVMAVVQDLRARAQASGALKTTPQQTIVVEKETIRIVPAEEKVVYVPQYNPQVVYVHDDDDDDDGGGAAVVAASAISFGAGLALGAWLDMDCDWHGCGVAYCRPGYWGGYGHRGAVAWGDDWAAAVGPRRAAVVGEHGGAYVGPRGAAVWGDNGRGAAWSRGGGAYGRPAYGGRYANYNRSTNVSGNQRFSNNTVNVNQNNVNVDRGDRTNISGGDRTNIGGDRVNAGGDRRAGDRTEGGRGALGDSGGKSDTRRSSDRGQNSREASGQRDAGKRSDSPSRQDGDRSSSARSSSGHSSFGDGGNSREATKQHSNRGSSSRRSAGGGGRHGGGGRRGR